jgi:hypothetical protein
MFFSFIEQLKNGMYVKECKVRGTERPKSVKELTRNGICCIIDLRFGTLPLYKKVEER